MITPALALAGAAALALLLSRPARAFGYRFRLFGRDRRRIPATGGLAFLAAFGLPAALFGLLKPRELLGLGLAAVLAVALGLRDARRPLGAGPQLAGQLLLAILVTIVGGITARAVTHPFGGLLFLDTPVVAGLTLPGVLLTSVWILLLVNAVNFLDGSDGLAATVSTVGFLTVSGVGLLPHVREPNVVTLGALAAGAMLGILFWNFPPARLALGTAGAWSAGLLLASFSVLGASKMATLAVVGAIPLLDSLAVVGARLRRGASPFRGDETHLHHRLAARGWSPRRIVAVYAACSAVLGVAAVLLPTPAKIALLLSAAAAVATRTLKPRARLTRASQGP